MLYDAVEMLTRRIPQPQFEVHEQYIGRAYPVEESRGAVYVTSPRLLMRVRQPRAFRIECVQGDVPRGYEDNQYASYLSDVPSVRRFTYTQET